MKGISHFVTGVAVATFFPEVVYGAAQSLSFGPLLGGLAGLLPDTLDFKFVRYFERVDDEIDPGQVTTPSGLPDPQSIAERIAAAMDRAYDSGYRVKIRLHTLQLGADRWRQYTVAFDVPQGQVMVRIGPVVTTGQLALPSSEVPRLVTGRAAVQANIHATYDQEIKIDAFSGPSFAFERREGSVHVSFLPWHRAWSHSLLLVAVLGVLGSLLSPVYGLVMALAALAHIVEDQFGYMGSNLLFPLTRTRTTGLRLMHSGDAVGNFLLVWLGMACIFLNLDRFSSSPALPIVPYVLAVMLVPSILLLGLSLWGQRRARRHSGLEEQGISPSAMAAIELLDEGGQVDI